METIKTIETISTMETIATIETISTISTIKNYMSEHCVRSPILNLPKNTQLCLQIRTHLHDISFSTRCCPTDVTTTTSMT